MKPTIIISLKTFFITILVIIAAACVLAAVLTVPEARNLLPWIVFGTLGYAILRYWRW